MKSFKEALKNIFIKLQAMIVKVLRNFLWREKFKVIVDMMHPEIASATTTFLVLDIGCHDCRLSDICSNLSKHIEYVGIDINLMVIQNTRKKKGVQVILADACALPFRRASFDFCVLSEVIEHIPQLDNALLEAFRVLKERGNSIFVIPNDTNFKIAWILLGKIKEAFLNRGHVHQFNRSELSSLLFKYGMICNECGIPFNIPFQLCLNYAVKVTKR